MKYYYRILGDIPRRVPIEWYSPGEIVETNYLINDFWAELVDQGAAKKFFSNEVEEVKIIEEVKKPKKEGKKWQQ